jgi:CheY-like chemotaxis protein
MSDSGYVLIVDDDPGTLNMLEDALRLMHLKARRAVNGREAMDMIGQTQPAVIILDLMMPVMSGISMILQMQDDPVKRRIPVIVFSALGDRQTMIDHLPGIVGSLPKGQFSLNALRGMLVKAGILGGDGAPRL